ncbi:Transposable element Hobo transposase [Frankliniella fusca]|uniref:Transposable element Hobo transposase n=1 Tax=Frankliniella fusca TaxID=407009 RepID=A0AAE1HI72_9NEOP|nr:Transposable element Hobo transposase [Frankliniella fusca]
MVQDVVNAVRDKNEALYNEIRQKLKDDVYTLKKKTGRTSLVWKHFKVVNNHLDTELGVAKCNNCDTFYKYGDGNGSSTMLKHINKCVRDPAPRPVVTAQSRERAKAAVVRWVVEGMKAHESVDSEAFIEMMQVGIDIGHTNGNVDAHELLPRSTCVREGVLAEAKRKREEQLPRIRKAMRDGGCEFDEDASGTNIKDKILEKVRELDIPEDDFKNVTFVTDNGSNVVSATEEGGWCRNYCLAHALNIVVRSGIELKYHDLLRDGFNAVELSGILEKCDDAVKHIKALPKKQLSPTHAKLPKLLKRAKRQHSSYTQLLASLRDHFDSVQECLKSTEREPLCDPVSVAWLDALIEVIAPFDFDGSREKAAEVSTTRCPQLLAHCTIQESDMAFPEIATLKKFLHDELNVVNVLQLVENCKKLVTYLRTTGLDEATTNLKQEFEVRWNTHVEMLNSVDRNWIEIKTALTGAKALEKIQCIDRERLQLLIKFWKPFRTEILKLEGEDYPTLPLACLSISSLQDHCQEPLQRPSFSDDFEEELFEEEEDDFRRLRMKTARLLDTVPQITVTHQIAFFLYPKYRELLTLSPQERATVLRAVRNLIAAQVGEEELTVSSPPKRSKLEESYEKFDEKWSSLRDSQQNFACAAPAPYDEVSRYLSEAQSIPSIETLLDWWSTQGKAYPRLGEIAWRIFGIPATSASCERLFSNAGFIVNVRRTNLKPKVIDAHVFLYKEFVRDRKREREREAEKRRLEIENEEKEKEERKRKRRNVAERAGESGSEADEIGEIGETGENGETGETCDD